LIRHNATPVRLNFVGLLRVKKKTLIASTALGDPLRGTSICPLGSKSQCRVGRIAERLRGEIYSEPGFLAFVCRYLPRVVRDLAHFHQNRIILPPEVQSSDLPPREDEGSA
jgi:hypothetical protein